MYSWYFVCDVSKRDRTIMYSVIIEYNLQIVKQHGELLTALYPKLGPFRDDITPRVQAIVNAEAKQGSTPRVVPSIPCLPDLSQGMGDKYGYAPDGYTVALWATLVEFFLCMLYSRDGPIDIIRQLLPFITALYNRLKAAIDNKFSAIFHAAMPPLRNLSADARLICTAIFTLLTQLYRLDGVRQLAGKASSEADLRTIMGKFGTIDNFMNKLNGEHGLRYFAKELSDTGAFNRIHYSAGVCSNTYIYIYMCVCVCVCVCMSETIRLFVLF
jgi:hypothetical protein